jgi:uncharacterized membrane protein YjjP (DUF1212 family)
MVSHTFREKVEFILLLARSLQACGAAAHHLERALSKAGRSLGVHSEYLAFPTGILASFSSGSEHRSVVLRLQPGQVDLSRLSRIDEAADQVIDGQLSLDQGIKALERIAAAADDYPKIIQVLAYALASGGFVTALKGSWTDLIAASLIGCTIGLMDVSGHRWPRFQQLFPAAACFLATVLATTLAPWIRTLTPDIVILSSIIVLIPGLALVVSFVELSTKNLIAGTARLAGAIGDLLKLVFTVAITKKLLPGPDAASTLSSHNQLPAWMEILGVAALALGFIVLFRVRPKHFISAFCVSIAAYGIARLGSERLGLELSFFVAGATVAMSSNLLARLLHRPGLITLLPGIILIVPGSINYRGFVSMFQQDVMDTVRTSFAVVIIAVSLVAGLFFGNTIVPPRRSL